MHTLRPELSGDDPLATIRLPQRSLSSQSLGSVCALRRESHVCVVVVTVNDFLASVACSVTFD